MDTAHWAPGAENPADGLTKVRSEMAPSLRLLESGHFRPGSLRLLGRAAWEICAGHDDQKDSIPHAPI